MAVPGKPGKVRAGRKADFYFPANTAAKRKEVTCIK